ncbi:diguanylate cyclase (GGDEF)-like protein/PAS domain S-box-containing protein [Kurthia huakuii]|nr:GGDEF domain-containing phosphodiesterase [Kurthia huakuii]MBM7700816.1 diguanylate cyclase (GGDEF)-like protein/PAS domain S-box-containing protein [Kurthia huakuii]
MAAFNESVIVAITDAKGKILSVNNQFCEISKYSPEELIGQDHRIVNSGYHSPAFFKNLWKTISSGEIWHGEICNRAKDGSLYWVKTVIVPFMNDCGKPEQYIAIRTDITEQKNTTRLKRFAYHDELTGLRNARSLKIHFKECIRHNTVYDKASVFILLNITRLKQVNDGYGHFIGDLFLLELTKCFQQIIGKNGDLFRYDGKQFVILTTRESYRVIVDTILELFEQAFTIEHFQFYSSINIGVSFYEEHADTLDVLLKYADLAMVKTKKEKGNRCLVFDYTMNLMIEEQLDLEKRLRNALFTDKMMLFYQPKFEAKTHRLVGMEALMRWYDEEYGFIPPIQFIPFAEEVGLMPILGEWVLVTACTQMKRWVDAYPDAQLRVAVNISPLHLQEKDFVYTMKQILCDTGLAANYLEIEITELSFMNGTDVVAETIRELKQLGISIAIDDFGTGYSALSYLKKFPIDTLKIDKSFVRGIKEGTNDESMVTAIINLAHIMNMSVVVEGVETNEELKVVEKAKGDMIQGYYFHPALPVEQFDELLKEE